MNANEYLNRAYRLETRINDKTEQIRRLCALAAMMTAAYGREVVSHSRGPDSCKIRLDDKSKDILEVKQ